MAKTKKQTGRARNQNRARVVGGQDYEVRYEAKNPHLQSGREEGGRKLATVASGSTNGLAIGRSDAKPIITPARSAVEATTLH
jgi:hypothetical protein